MAKEDIAPYQKNLALKQAFRALDLDLNEVMEFTPYDLDLENARLESLLAFVEEYQKYGSQEVMEAVKGGFLFPPIHPGISPDCDWFRFELWMQHLPTKKTLAEQLPSTFELVQPDSLRDEELESALDKLLAAMHSIGFSLTLNDDIPPRLVYGYLMEELGETFELDAQGGWFLNGCNGYCPGCFQRPWCDIGQRSCWTEDEKAGKMHLPELLEPYVSASPQSLEILQRFQVEEDAEDAQFEAEFAEKYPQANAAEQARKALLN